VAARSALQSSQSGAAPVTASSTLELFAPAASADSTVRLSGNSNTALAVTNDATNTLTRERGQHAADAAARARPRWTRARAW
jgi:hypothetical protein